MLEQSRLEAFDAKLHEEVDEMSVRAEYVDGVFKPLDEVEGAASGKVYRVFSEEELRHLSEDLAWLKAAEKSFDFWNNKEDEVYDTL